jgi:YHS domain-containing protein
MKFLVSVCLLVMGYRGFSQSEDFRTKQFNLDDGVAIRGYDPVCYFSQNKALKGNKELSFSDHGIKYYFATESNRRLFQADPQKYEPQYGGWCAYAMGHDGSKVDIDPETFKIINGKLFLFYNHFFNNTLKSWNQDESGLHARADANWQKILPK